MLVVMSIVMILTMISLYIWSVNVSEIQNKLSEFQSI